MLKLHTSHICIKERRIRYELFQYLFHYDQVSYYCALLFSKYLYSYHHANEAHVDEFLQESFRHGIAPVANIRVGL